MANVVNRGEVRSGQFRHTLKVETLGFAMVKGVKERRESRMISKFLV